MKTRRRRRSRWWSLSSFWRHRSSRRRRRVFGQGSRRRARPPWRRAAGIAVLLVVGGLALFAAALAGDVRAARTDALGARQTLLVVAANPRALGQADGRAAARSNIDAALERLKRADQRVRRSAAMKLAAYVPLLGGQRDGLVGLVGDSLAAAETGRELFSTIEQEAEGTKIRAGQVPLGGLQRLEAAVERAGARFGGLVGTSSGLWPPLSDARAKFDDLAREMADRLGRGADALGAARSFLGAEGSRRYLVALQNNAEMRDQGMVLSYSLASFDQGMLAFEVGGSVQRLRLSSPAPSPIPPGTQAAFGSILPTQVWQSVNATADFAWSARAMGDMYFQATGSPVDGVIAVDVPGLAALLRAVGPVAIEGLAEPITHANVARILLRDFYEGIQTLEQNLARRERQADVTRAIIDRLTEGERDPLALGQELGHAASGGHLRLWSRAQAEEAVFERSGLGGGPAVEMADRTFHVSVENRTATKLDYYIRPRVRQEVRLDKSGDAHVRTTVTVQNPLPADVGASFALGPDVHMSRAGEYIAWLLQWSPAGSRQSGAIEESGLLLSHHVLHVNPAEARELSFVETVIPKAVRNGQLQLRLVPQSRLEPMPLEVTLTTDGWKVKGARSWSGPWDRVLKLTWDVRR